jgi:hypothetical protein
MTENILVTPWVLLIACSRTSASLIPSILLFISLIGHLTYYPPSFTGEDMPGKRPRQNGKHGYDYSGVLFDTVDLLK